MCGESWITSVILHLTNPSGFTQYHDFFDLMANKPQITSQVTGYLGQMKVAKRLFCIQRLGLLTHTCLPDMKTSYFHDCHLFLLLRKSPTLRGSAFLWGISFLVHERREEILFKIVICALASEIFKAMVMRSWPNITFMGHTGNFAFMAPSCMDKKYKN